MKTFVDGGSESSRSSLEQRETNSVVRERVSLFQWVLRSGTFLRKVMSLIVFLTLRTVLFALACLVAATGTATA